MSRTNAPRYQAENGYLTQATRKSYIKRAVEAGLLPPHARRMEKITSLQASHDPQVAIQFWQLFSVLGPEPIVGIVAEFYQRVFHDEPWFTSVLRGSATLITIFQLRPACGSMLWGADPIITGRNSG